MLATLAGKKKKMLTGGDRPEALLVPGEAFQVGQTIDGSRGAPRVSHAASVPEKGSEVIASTAFR